MKKKPLSFWLILSVVVLVGIIAASGFYRVDEGEDSLLLTFGEITDHRGPGLYWAIPFVQEVHSVSVTNIMTFEYGFRTSEASSVDSAAVYSDMNDESIMLTGDSNIVDVNVIYQVVIKDVESYLFHVNNPERTLHLAFETVLRRNIQNRSLDDALLNKQEIELEVLQDLREAIARYDMGIDLREVRIQNIVVPQEAMAAYEDVNNAKNEKTRRLDEGERYYNEVVPEARAEAYRMIQDAEAYRAEAIAKAEGDVANFNQIYAKYLSAREITRSRLLIETMESILSRAQIKYVTNGTGGMLQFLPLDQTGSADTTPAATPEPTSTPELTPTPEPTNAQGGQ